MHGHFVILEKLFKENNRSICKNLPNLVTLFAARLGKIVDHILTILLAR
jgi:hypothetical protein